VALGALAGPRAIPAAIRPIASADDRWMRAALQLVIAGLAASILLPLASLFALSLQDRDGSFVGLDNFARYLATPALADSIINSLGVALATVVITVPLAFGFAYCLTRTCMPLRWLFNAIATIPLLAPSLLAAIALIYLFGNQGLLRGLMAPDGTIYGPVGIIAAQVFFTFPQALILLITGLAAADARLYEAATALGTPAHRVFLTVTLPGARYGLISAVFVVFTQVVTDFGVAKVIGGQFNMLATDVYKQVVGQQNFSMGAVIGLVLLFPAVAAFLVDRHVQSRQIALLTARAVPLVPQPNRRRDWLAFGFCAVIAALILLMIGTAAWASFVTYWPYNLSLTLRHYDLDEADSAGWSAVWNTLRLGFWTACLGTPLAFFGAYLMDRTRRAGRLADAGRMLAVLPLAVPGLVLGIAYIFFFNAPWNPLSILYGTMALLVLNTVVHLFPVCHLTATTALKSIDREFESVSASLKVSTARTLWRVTLPLCLPTVLNIWIYFFLNAATTLSAIIFLYVTDTKTASIAIVNMDEAGATAAAAAMAMMIVLACATVKGLQLVLGAALERSTQAWRRR
jgi:iron(III) transport system permease protein